MKDTTRKWMRLLCAVVFLCAVGFLAFHFVKEAREKELYEKIKGENRKEVEVPEEVVETPEETVEIPIDFDGLQEMNPDIYAWITIPGTQIDYPILQHTYDDTFYLDHTADGESGSVGSIYTELQTSEDFSDFNTVIYGHNVPNGTMFRGLHEFKDPEYLKEHSQVIIYTPDAMRVYEIYAAVVYGDQHILNTYDFTQETHRQEFIDSVRNARDMNNNVREEIAVTPNDRLLTLSTCIKTQRDNRFIVGAVLVDEKKAENSAG